MVSEELPFTFQGNYLGFVDQAGFGSTPSEALKDSRGGNDPPSVPCLALYWSLEDARRVLGCEYKDTTYERSIGYLFQVSEYHRPLLELSYELNRIYDDVSTADENDIHDDIEALIGHYKRNHGV